MRAQAYCDLIDRQRKEVSDFPIAFAFNKQQTEEALEKLGAKDISECVTVCGFGDIVKKENAKPFVEMLKRHAAEVKEALNDEEFAEAAFLYEMDNHEYAINWDGDDDILACFDLTYEELKEKGLMGAYSRARKEHYRHAEEWGMI